MVSWKTSSSVSSCAAVKLVRFRRCEAAGVPSDGSAGGSALSAGEAGPGPPPPAHLPAGKAGGSAGGSPKRSAAMAAPRRGPGLAAALYRRGGGSAGAGVRGAGTALQGRGAPGTPPGPAPPAARGVPDWGGPALLCTEDSAVPHACPTGWVMAGSPRLSSLNMDSRRERGAGFTSARRGQNNWVLGVWHPGEDPVWWLGYF